MEWRGENDGFLTWLRGWCSIAAVQKPAGYRRDSPAPILNGWSLLRRLGRTCFWHDPSLYRWIGRARGRGDCLAVDFDIWVDGYPGSASALAATLLQQANPTAQIAPRRHLPPFILNALYKFKPGMLLVSPPDEAVVSWTILSRGAPGDCLDYYLDFHHKLRANAPWLFIVTPGELMSQFDTVMEIFNLHFQTNYAAPEPGAVEKFKTREGARIQPDSAHAELRIERLVPKGSGVRQELRRRMEESPRLRSKLEMARHLYKEFVPANRKVPMPPLNLTTRHLPTMA